MAITMMTHGRFFCMEVLGCKKMVGKPPHVQVLIPNSGSGQNTMDSSKALLISYPQHQYGIWMV